MEMFNLLVWGGIFIKVVVQFIRSICVVPTKTAYVVERFGKYDKTLGPGFHALIPFVDKVAYVHDLKEEAIDVPPQECFSKDEVNVSVDGVIYIVATNATKASYGVTSYRYAAIQLAQTTIRSVIGTLELDRIFEERDIISSEVVNVLDKAGESWGIRVQRYEIKNVTPPPSVNNAMERQVTAERERLAILARSEGDKMAKINMSEGRRREMINNLRRGYEKANERSRREGRRNYCHCQGHGRIHRKNCFCRRRTWRTRGHSIANGGEIFSSPSGSGQGKDSNCPSRQYRPF